jgi:hypothetical protein
MKISPAGKFPMQISAKYFHRHVSRFQQPELELPMAYFFTQRPGFIQSGARELIPKLLNPSG